jgi:hypothetical protein
MTWGCESGPEARTRLDSAAGSARQEVEALQLGGLEFTPLEGARSQAIELLEQESYCEVALARYGEHLEVEVRSL